MNESKELAKEIVKYFSPWDFKKSGGSKEDYRKFLDGERVIILKEYEMHYEGMALSVFKSFPDQARMFCKVVPSYEDDPDRIEKILNAQGWCCI